MGTWDVLNSGTSLELFPFQKKVLVRMKELKGRALLALEMGLGKTAIMLTFLRDNRTMWPAVVVCPASVKYQWRRECQRWWGINATVLEGKTPSTIKPSPLVIVNYDILVHWLDALLYYNPVTVVVDESQYISNPKTKRSKAVRSLAYRKKHVIALSGTPLLNRPIELFNTLQMLWPWEWKSRWEFARRYCEPKWTPWGWKFSGASNVKELHQRLVRSGMIRYRKSDVLQELPPKNREVISLPISDPDKYRIADEQFLEYLSQIDPEAAMRARRAEAITKIGYLLRLSAELKLPYVLEFINNWLDQTDEKLVIFAVHKDVISKIKEGVKFPSVVLDGSVAGENRQRIIDSFQNDPNVRVFIGQLVAAGSGITLTAASTVMFVEMDWVPSRFTQAEDRVHRIGVRDSVTCLYLVAECTVEERLCEIIQSKQEVVSNVLDGRFVDGDLDVYRLLIGGIIGRSSGVLQ